MQMLRRIDNAHYELIMALVETENQADGWSNAAELLAIKLKLGEAVAAVQHARLVSERIVEKSLTAGM